MMMCFELFRYNVSACMFVKETGLYCFFCELSVPSQSYFHLFLVSSILFFLCLRVSILDLIITSNRIVWLKKNEYLNYYATSFRDHLFSIFPCPRLNAPPILKASTIRHLTKLYKNLVVVVKLKWFILVHYYNVKSGNQVSLSLLVHQNATCMLYCWAKKATWYRHLIDISQLFHWTKLHINLDVHFFNFCSRFQGPLFCAWIIFFSWTQSTNYLEFFKNSWNESTLLITKNSFGYTMIRLSRSIS